MFRKRSLGRPLLPFYSCPDGLGRAAGKSEDLHDRTEALPNLGQYSQREDWRKCHKVRNT